MIRFVTTLILIATLLWSCSSTTDVADTTSGSETTNGYIALLSDGSPATNATVRFIDKEKWLSLVESGLSPVVDSTKTDSMGFFIVPKEKSSLKFQIDHNREALLLDSLSDTVTLSPYKRVTGLLPLEVSEVLIPGTDWQGTIKGDSFSLRLPDGTYPILIKKGATLSISEVIRVVHDSSILLEDNSNSLLFDNFSGGFKDNPLGNIYDSIGWYSFSDSLKKEFTSGGWVDGELSSHKGSSDIIAAISKGALTLSVHLRSKAAYPYAGIGAAFYKDGAQGFDLSAMTHLRFRARGSGTITISLESDSLDALSISQYQIDITPNDTWQEFVVSVEDFHLEKKDSTYEVTYPWSKISKKIDKMEFIYRATNNGSSVDHTIEIDYIFFDGVLLSNL